VNFCPRNTSPKQAANNTCYNSSSNIIDIIKLPPLIRTISKHSWIQEGKRKSKYTIGLFGKARAYQITCYVPSVFQRKGKKYLPVDSRSTTIPAVNSHYFYRVFVEREVRK